MDRASLTVVLTNGVRLDAMMVTPTWRDGDNHPMLSFVCSGRMASYPVEEIQTVEFFHGTHAGAPFCGMCEQPLPGQRPERPVVVGP